MYAIGVDVSKGKSTIAINYNGELMMKPFDIEHTEDGIIKLFEKLQGVEKEKIRFVMEATGVYHLPVLTRLLELGFFVCVENAFLMKKHFDVGLRKVKTDKKDAIKLAKYCSDKWNELKAYSMQDSIYENLKFLSRQYSQQVALKVKAKVQFSNLLEVTFPNFNTIFHSDSQYYFMLDVYEKYPHPYAVREVEETSFIKEIEEIGKKRGHRIGLRVGLELYALAKNIIPTRPNDKYTQLAVTTCVNSLRTLEKATEDIIAQMDELAKELPEYNVVGEMGGVGRKLRPRIIAEIGDERKYKKAGSLIAIAGIDTPPYESGKFKAENVHISKRGNKYLRKCGYEIVKCLKSRKPKTDTSVYEYVIKKETEGKPLRVCKIAGLNKFLRIYYARVTEIYQGI
jgi:transposase